ncbi:uncharacterized protein LOC119181843 isoform X1 [Rhipicephalus microplus]|uniref:uncharacterized protein LOC119181843 isoform X1 n=2 Tax=Rhipicephalus microplus TaxID=6941 RepID=UPI003F6CE1F6
MEGSSGGLPGGASARTPTEARQVPLVGPPLTQIETHFEGSLVSEYGQQQHQPHDLFLRYQAVSRIPHGLGSSLDYRVPPVIPLRDAQAALPRPATLPDLSRLSSGADASGEDEHALPFQDQQFKCLSERSRPRARLTRSKAVTAMHLDLSPSQDCCARDLPSCGGNGAIVSSQGCFVPSPCSSYTSGHSASVPHSASPEDPFDCFADFQEEEFFAQDGIVGDVKDSVFVAEKQSFGEDLSSLGLFVQHDQVFDAASPAGSLVRGDNLEVQRFSLPEVAATREDVCKSVNDEESPVAALFEADEQLRMAPDVGSSCSDLSAMTSSSPTLSTFTSNRSSARSSFTSRRSKRSLSISPTSTDGMDLNTIIRSSPTSLVAYLNGNRGPSSTSAASSLATATAALGAYGHLSARPSSPRGNAQHRISTPYSPTLLKMAAKEEPSSPFDNTGFVLQAIDEVDPLVDFRDYDFLEPEDNLAVVQQQEADKVLPVAVVADGASERAGPASQAIGYGEAVVDSTQPLPSVASLLVDLQKPPPPSYDQHMARKLAFQKMYSSDSSQPSNYSSFESTGSADAAELAEVDSTTGCELFPQQPQQSQQPRSYDCQWIDCRALFDDQEMLVRHIESCHIDQKVRDEYTCFWQSCPRRHRPFNARYKLLIHMRVHSGEKPNRCTFDGCTKAFSRLENLKIHLRSHTGERPYSCQYPGCPKAFSNSSDRAKHQRTHQDTKPYACMIPGCCKRYTDPSSLRKHYKNHLSNEDAARKKIRSENEPNSVGSGNPGSMADTGLDPSLQPAYSLRDRPKLEHADSGIGRSPGASSVNDYRPGPGSRLLHLSHSDNDIRSRSSPNSRYARSPGISDDKLHPQGYPIPLFRTSSFTETSLPRSPTTSVLLEVPRSEAHFTTAGGQHYSLEVPVPPQQCTSSMDQQEDDIQEALALHNMRQMRPLEHLGDSLSSREDSADEAPPLPLDQQPLPPFDAFYSSCLLFEDPSHFGGVS